MNGNKPNIQIRQAQAPDAQAFIGRYLNRKDFEGPLVVTIEDVAAEQLEGTVRPKLVVKFCELTKPLVLNTTNIRSLIEIFGTSDTSAWRGAVMLYVEENVTYAGAKVGGIRVDAAPNQTNGQGARPYRLAAG